MLRRFGFLPGLRKMLRLLSRSRMYYCVLREDRIVSDGDISLSFCRYYDVDPGSAVIGPVWTSGNRRGGGLATEALKLALNELIKMNINVFYVDTAGDNAAMQRVIEKCGFGEPVRTFEKEKERRT